MLIELDKVIELIDKYNDNKIKGIVDLRMAIIRLAYGKVYKCLNCNKDIYFNLKGSEKHQVYFHLSSNDIRCNLNFRADTANLAIPKPESLEE